MKKINQIVGVLFLFFLSGEGLFAMAADPNTDFLEFEVNRVNETKVELIWSTASELNSEGFHIERLLEGESEWVNVGWLKGFGTDIDKHLYHWADENAHVGTCYYRIKKQGVDNSFTYSEVLLLEGQSMSNDIQIFPIPTEDFVHLNLGTRKAQNISIKIITKDGQLMYEGELSTPPNNIITVKEIAAFPAGLYIMQLLMNDGEKVIQKFFKAQRQ